MSSKVIKLHVHKNTLEKRKRKELREEALRTLKEMLTECDPISVTIVVIDKGQHCISYQSEDDLRPAERAVLLKDALRDLIFNDELTVEEEQEKT